MCVRVSECLCLFVNVSACFTFFSILYFMVTVVTTEYTQFTDVPNKFNAAFDIMPP
jgi:hypothetical protein